MVVAQSSKTPPLPAPGPHLNLLSELLVCCLSRHQLPVPLPTVAIILCNGGLTVALGAPPGLARSRQGGARVLTQGRQLLAGGIKLGGVGM